MPRTIPAENVLGAFASPARAAEIALLDEFGLGEFTELTGVGVGVYGLYQVEATGVSLHLSQRLSELTVHEQHAVHKAAQGRVLEFPCTPNSFIDWYDATRGETHPKDPPGSAGASDFPIARGFVEELRRHEVGSSTSEPSVPSGQIIAVFNVKSDPAANAAWWDLRLRNPGRYRLQAARALKGGAKRPSRWHPAVVAGWLIQEKHLPRESVVRAMRHGFQQYDTDLL